MSTVLITGISGQLGQATLAHLAAHLPGHGPAGTQLIGTTRDPAAAKARHAPPAGVTLRAADYDAPETLAPAFAGVDVAVLISTDALVEPGQRERQQRAAVQALEAAGVQHVVYTSLPGVGSSDAAMTRDHAATEAALAESTMGYTVLRNNLYMENLFATLPGALASGTLHHARAGGRIAWVTRADCARAAAHAALAALAAPSARRTVDVTGPEALDTAALLAAVNAALGTDIGAAVVPLAALEEAMRDHGMPALVATAIASLDQLAAEGLLGTVTDAVQNLTGQAPTSLTAFLDAHRNAFA